MESGHQIETSNAAYFRHGYDSEHADMRRLYERQRSISGTRRPTSTGHAGSTATAA